MMIFFKVLNCYFRMAKRGGIWRTVRESSRMRRTFFIAADPAHLSGTGIPAMKNHSAAEAAAAKVHAKAIME